ncbi:hypothetical protein [Ferrovibrio sp.]|uniref:hypothetical protein n=1 Tax=Ferrovibrio sp. TaxID=1917215 RepID=UPI001B5EBEC8|nr:hypothetical protein [Ferrovibrio sp.]MBP7066553.1 hypothetical protein [Ferrovibrio sp.]
MSAVLFTALFGWHTEYAVANAADPVSLAYSASSDAVPPDAAAGDETPAPAKLVQDCAVHCDQHGRAMPVQLRVQMVAFPSTESPTSLRDAGIDLGLIFGLLEPPRA